MNILFAVNNNSKNGGPENWRRLMVYELSKNHIVYETSSINPLVVFKNVYKSDILQTYVACPSTIMAIIFSKLLGKKIVHKISGDYYAENNDKKGIKKIFWLPLNIFCSSFSDVITFPSVYIKEIICKHEPYSRNKSRLIPNGVDLDKVSKTTPFTKRELGIEDSSLLLVEVTGFNNLEKAKGIDILTTSFHKLDAHGRNKYLFILGDGKYFDYYKRKYEADNIRFLGHRTDALRYIKTCDLFVHFSLLDNFPNVLLEAMACNKPIQALPSGGIPEMLPAECLSNGDINLGVKCIYTDKISTYSISNVSKKFFELYESLL